MKCQLFWGLRSFSLFRSNFFNWLLISYYDKNFQITVFLFRNMLVSQLMKIKMYLKKQIRMIKVYKKTISILLNIIQKLMIVLRRFLKRFLKIILKRLLNKLLKKIQKVEKMKILSMIWMTRLCTKC